MSGVFLDGTSINGTADTVNRTASGTYSVSVFVSGVLAVHSGTWSMSRKTALPNSAPLAVADSYSTTAKQSLAVGAVSGVLGNDSDPDGDPLSANLGSGPSHGSLSLNADGSFGYTPDAAFASMDSFTYRANDELTNSNLATATIDVENNAPVALDDSYDATAARPLTVEAGLGVLANDTDSDGHVLTAILVGGPSNGTLDLDAGGGFTYTPDMGTRGPDGFAYRASDGIVTSDEAEAVITVKSIAQPWLLLLDRGCARRSSIVQRQAG